MNDDVKAAAAKEDPFALAQTLTNQELERLELAEAFLDKQHARKKRRNRFAQISTSLVGFVAFGGLLVNAYQSHTNAQKQLRQQEADEARWNKEFERAKASDKYRAFFETSVLASDPTNPNKRLVGYALLQEFVEDRDYNSKATLMLEESLLQELRSDTAESGLDDAHRNAVVAILTSLSQTSDCHALDRPARSIGEIARRHAETHDLEETREVFGVYVRRVIGRAAEICPTMKEFKAVRRPILETLLKVPEIGELPPKTSPSVGSAKMAEILESRCLSEIQVTGASDCPEIFAHYAKLCATGAPAELKGEEAACARVKAAALESAAAAQQAHATEPSEKPADAPAP